MAINLLFDRVIDYSVEDLINLNVTGNILVTRDANTPAGDPVVVNLSNLADVQALSRIVVENDATVVAGGGLASVGAIKKHYGRWWHAGTGRKRYCRQRAQLHQCWARWRQH